MIGGRNGATGYDCYATSYRVSICNNVVSVPRLVGCGGRKRG